VQTLDAHRILSADRRGSSWPVLVETNDGLRFAKLRGAAQGTAPLVAEIIVGTIAESLGLNVPARAIVRLPHDIPSDDRHQELRDLLDRSVGENLGFTYLDSAAMLDAAELKPSETRTSSRISGDDAAAIVWLDALVMNPDRTAHNTNLMRWQNRLWLIDHGAALGFQYSWSSVTESSPKATWSPTQPHALAHLVTELDTWDDILAARVTRDVLEDAVAQVPDSFLLPLLPSDIRDLESLHRRRAGYVAFLWKRLAAPRTFFRDITAIQDPAPRRPRPDWLKSPSPSTPPQRG
jgi:hypothetical protein